MDHIAQSLVRMQQDSLASMDSPQPKRLGEVAIDQDMAGQRASRPAQPAAKSPVSNLCMAKFQRVNGLSGSMASDFS